MEALALDCAPFKTMKAMGETYQSSVYFVEYASDFACKSKLCFYLILSTQMNYEEFHSLVCTMRNFTGVSQSDGRGHKYEFLRTEGK